jgi:hypothetical protein
LVYSTTATEYRQYMVSLGVHFAPPNDTLTPITASNLNQASIAVGKLAGIETVSRHVKNVGSSTATYTASASVPGMTVQVSPSTLTLAPGEDKAFTVTFTRGTAPLNAWAFGHLTWTDGTHVVRSPIAVQPVTVSAPTEVHGDASASGSKDYQVTPGFSGPLSTDVVGLVGVTPIADSVVTGEYDINAPVADADTKHYTVTVPAGTAAARFSLDSADNTADLDLFVYQGGTLVALSASGAADEQVTMRAPAAGTYDIFVNGFSTPGGTTSYNLANFVLPAGNAGNGNVTPNPAAGTVGVPLTLTANWAGLDPATRWFGYNTYGGTDTITYFSVG